MASAAPAGRRGRPAADRPCFMKRHSGKIRAKTSGCQPAGGLPAPRGLRTAFAAWRTGGVLLCRVAVFCSDVLQGQPVKGRGGPGSAVSLGLLLSRDRWITQVL